MVGSFEPHNINPQVFQKNFKKNWLGVGYNIKTRLNLNLYIYLIQNI